MNYRHTLNIDYKKLYELFGDSMIFIAFDKKDYDIFTERSGINIEYYKPTTFIEVCTIIKSCRLLVAGMSAFLCIGHATHVPRIIGLCDSIGDNKHNLQFDEIWSNVYYGVK
jgi:hypothetical protein